MWIRFFFSVASVVTVAAAVSPAWAQQRVDYTGHKLVRVQVSSEDDLKQLQTISPDLWTEGSRLGEVPARIPPERMNALEDSGLAYEVVIEDLGPLTRPSLRTQGRSDEFTAYMTFAEIVTFINDLAASRPDLCQVIDIGDSIEGRDLWVLHITGPAAGPKPAVFYESLIHAREWISAPVVLYFAQHLIENYDADPCVRALVDNVDIYLMPCVNPDGYAYSWSTDRLWRKNRRLNDGGSYGVDLNRNWGYMWGYAGSSSAPASMTYRGTDPFSEPESSAVSQFIAVHPNMRAFVDYHSFSELILYPWGYACTGGPPEPDRTIHERVTTAYQDEMIGVGGEYYYTGPGCDLLYQTSGTTVDWTYGDQDILSFTVELRPRGENPGFLLPPEEIIPTCLENLPAMLRLTDWARSALSVTLPSGAPAEIDAGASTPINVVVHGFEPGIGLASPLLHYRYDAAANYLTTPLTHVAGEQFTATLPATNCTSQVEYYFTAVDSNGWTATLPCGAPAERFTAVVRQDVSVFYTENLDTDPGWAREGDWAYGQPTGGGSNDGDPTSGYTGPNVFGYNLAGDYPGLLPSTYLTTTPIDCTGRHGVTLQYRRWLGLESERSYDDATIEVSSNGTDWTVAWRAVVTRDNISDAAWTLHEVDISDVADDQPAVWIRWGMGPTDVAVTFPGWNIDDVQLRAVDCSSPPGDYDGDNLVTTEDAVPFPACVAGPSGGIPPNCGIFDFDADGDVDLADFAGLTNAI